MSFLDKFRKQLKSFFIFPIFLQDFKKTALQKDFWLLRVWFLKKPIGLISIYDWYDCKNINFILNTSVNKIILMVAYLRICKIASKNGLRRGGLIFKLKYAWSSRTPTCRLSDFDETAQKFLGANLGGKIFWNE